MSRLKEISDQFKNIGLSLGQKIQESSAFIQLQEKYDSLQPTQQKLTKIIGAFLIIFLLVFPSITSIMSSSEMVTVFEERRDLIRELFKVYRETSSTVQVQVPPPMESFRSSVSAVLMGANLTTEQNLGVIQSSTEGKLIPEGLINYVAEVKLAKLNIRQVTDIGVNLSNISESIKLKDISLTANAEDQRYYDVSYKFYSLKVPEPTIEPPPEPEPKPRGRGKGNN